MSERRSVVSGRALFESGLIVGLLVAVVACGVIATQPHTTVAGSPTEADARAAVRADVERLFDLPPDYLTVENVKGDTATIVLELDGFIPRSRHRVTLRNGWAVTRSVAVRGKPPGAG